MSAPPKPQSGDIVHVRGVYTAGPNGGSGFVTFKVNDGGDCLVRVLDYNITYVEPRPLRIGDKVRLKLGSTYSDSPMVGTLAGIADQWAWVRYPSVDGQQITPVSLKLANLERAP